MDILMANRGNKQQGDPHNGTGNVAKYGGRGTRFSQRSKFNKDETDSSSQVTDTADNSRVPNPRGTSSTAESEVAPAGSDGNNKKRKCPFYKRIPGTLSFIDSNI